MVLYNLQPYFERIGFHGNATPTLETLRSIQHLHTETIPFENLNPLLGIPVSLDLQSLEGKLLHAERGGYCFEQNHLMKKVLETIGFRVTGLGAHARWHRLCRTGRGGGPGSWNLGGPEAVSQGTSRRAVHAQ